MAKQLGGEEGVEMVRKLTEAVFNSGMIPVDWEELSWIFIRARVKPLTCGNYHNLKLTDQVMKLLKRVLDSSIHQMVNIDEMPYAFVPGRGTTDAIFTIRQL